MVLDSSVLVAIMQREPGWQRLRSIVASAERRLISAATLIETSLVIEGRRGPNGELELDTLLIELPVEIVPVDAAQAALARSAFRRFGKGRHAAALNFGDLFSYALARSLAEPLLFVGNDFSRTDFEPALPAD